MFLLAAFQNGAAHHAADAPDGLAIAAFVIALVGLLWNIVVTIVRWPRIAADISQIVGIGGANSTRYAVYAINAGAEDVTVWNAGVALRGSPNMVADVVNERANGRKVDGPDLPARLEGRATMKWTFEPHGAVGIPRGAKVLAAVQRYRPIRWFHRESTVPWREVRSVRSRTRE